MKIKGAVLVTSDRVSRGEREDESGEIARELLGQIAEVVEKKVVPDQAERIREALLAWCERGIDVVITIGGTGLSPSDMTAQVTHSLIEKEARGISTALLVRGLADTPQAMLSSAEAGVRGHTLIVNLPGSKSAVRDSIEYLRDMLPHAIEMMWGGGHETPAEA